MQGGKPRHRSLAARFSRIEPPHVQSRRKLYPRLQDPPDQIVVRTVAALFGERRKSGFRLQKPLNQIVVSLPVALIVMETLSSQLQRHGNGSLKNLGKKVAIGSRCEVEEHTLVVHLLEL